MCAPGCQLFGGACRPYGMYGGMSSYGGGFGGYGGYGGFAGAMIAVGSQCGIGYHGYCGGGSICNSGYCSCPTGYIIQNSVCMSMSSLSVSSTTISYVGQSCGGFTQCGGGSFCTGGLCSCPPTYITSGLYCISSFGGYNGYGGYGLGATMMGSAIGFGGGLGGCGFGGIAYPGQMCGGGCGCGGGATCMSSMCACPPNCIIRNNVCVVQQTSYVQVGSTCGGMGQMCIGGSACIQSSCQCGFGFYQQNRMCLRRSKPASVIAKLVCISKLLHCRIKAVRKQKIENKRKLSHMVLDEIQSHRYLKNVCTVIAV